MTDVGGNHEGGGTWDPAANPFKGCADCGGGLIPVDCREGHACCAIARCVPGTVDTGGGADPTEICRDPDDRLEAAAKAAATAAAERAVAEHMEVLADIGEPERSWPSPTAKDNCEMWAYGMAAELGML